MADCLYSAKGWVETWCEPEKNVIRVKWYNYTSRVHVRQACEMQLEAMRTYRVCAIVSDASDALGIPFPQDIDWINSYLNPLSIELGLKAVISVMPRNPIARSGALSWNKQANGSELQQIQVNSLEEAEDLLEQIRNAEILNASAAQ